LYVDEVCSILNKISTSSNLIFITYITNHCI
jgi:hypothetical protein